MIRIHPNKKNDKPFNMKSTVDHNGRSYLVSTVNTLDCGLETMVFAIRHNGTIDFHDLYSALHSTEAEAEAHHKKVVANIGSVIDGVHNWD